MCIRLNGCVQSVFCQMVQVPLPVKTAQYANENAFRSVVIMHIEEPSHIICSDIF